MAQYSLLIKNAVVCTASDTFPSDIGIEDGKIAALCPDIDPGLAETVIDAEGAYVTPGGVDAHVHVDEPAKPFGNLSDTLETATRSAVAGGTTSVITFVKQEVDYKGGKDGTDQGGLVKVLNEFKEYAGNKIWCDWGAHLIITKVPDDMEGEISAVMAEGITSVKMYMTYPRLQLRDKDLLTSLYNLRSTGCTAMLHAENGDIVAWMTESLEDQGNIAPWFHGVSRPGLVEGEATNRAIVLAEVMDCPILFVHVSAKDAFDRIRLAQGEGMPIFAETCMQYLILDESKLQHTCHHTGHQTDGVSPEDGSFEGAKYVCSPPLRSPDGADQRSAWLSLANGTATILSSDHAPTNFTSPEGKRSAFANGHNGEFSQIPNGLAGVETRLPLAYTHGVMTGKLTLPKFVELTSTNPAKLYGMYPRKGSILPGASDADLVIWYPDSKYTGPAEVKNEFLRHAGDHTAFEGCKVGNWPRYTIVRGQVVFREQQLQPQVGEGLGEYVKRGKSSMAVPQNKWTNEWRPTYLKQ